MEEIRRITDSQWMTAPHQDVSPAVLDRCTSDVIASALAHLPAARVRKVFVNRSGSVDIPSSWFGMPAFRADGMPDYCQVEIEHRPEGGRPVTTEVWVPLVWNGRFLGTGGAGSRLTIGESSLIAAVKNGFTAARTDGGVGDDPRPYDWQFDEETSENNRELIENWLHASTHDMTLAGKAVAKAIHGYSPTYSYFHGSSGGGRQGLAAAQYHPADYDGIWSAMPAINWTRLGAAGIWPALVMKELNNALPAPKLEAFRKAAVADFNLKSGNGRPFISRLDAHSFDPFELVGTTTESGAITSTDARVMEMIWNGPEAPDGERLWYGIRPGVESWGATVPSLGLCCTTQTESGLVPEPAAIAVSWFRTWLLRNPEWDWTALTFEEYFHLSAKGIREFADIAMDDPDLRDFSANGSKLLVTHGVDDQIIPPEGTRLYFNRLFDRMGGVAATDTFARLFFCLGEGHGFTPSEGFSIDLATGMSALMKWVEQGIAPEELPPVKVGSPNSATEPGMAIRYAT